MPQWIFRNSGANLSASQSHLIRKWEPPSVLWWVRTISQPWPTVSSIRGSEWNTSDFPTWSTSSIPSEKHRRASEERWDCMAASPYWSSMIFWSHRLRKVSPPISLNCWNSEADPIPRSWHPSLKYRTGMKGSVPELSPMRSWIGSFMIPTLSTSRVTSRCGRSLPGSKIIKKQKMMCPSLRMGHS